MLAEVIASGAFTGDSHGVCCAANNAGLPELADHIVTMHNALVRAAHGLSLNEKRIVACCASMLNGQEGSRMTDHLSGQFVMRLTAQDYGDLFGINPKHVYRDLKKAVNRLFDSEYSITDAVTGKVTRRRWVCHAAYCDHMGYVEVAFSPFVFPYLQHLNRDFSQYRLGQASGFRCAYSYRLFEVLNSWRSAGWYACKVEDLRRMLEIPESYSTGSINARILTPSIPVIAGELGMPVHAIPDKDGKRIIGWTFYIGRDPKPAKKKSRRVKTLQTTPKIVRRR